MLAIRLESNGRLNSCRCTSPTKRAAEDRQGVVRLHAAFDTVQVGDSDRKHARSTCSRRGFQIPNVSQTGARGTDGRAVPSPGCGWQQGYPTVDRQHPRCPSSGPSQVLQQ